MNVQLGELVKDWPCTIKGSIRTEVLSIDDNANKIQPGTIFVARKGANFNGTKFINDAVTRGASAIVLDDELVYDSLELTIPIIWVPNCRSFLAFASAKMYGFPSEALKIVAVTGTNGKTTVTHFIGQLLKQLQQNVLVIGTNGIFKNGEKCYDEKEKLTTLQAKDLQLLFYEAVQNDIPYVVLEASSIGLIQHRLDYCEVALGVFLNITEDHIEEHGSFENYKRAKQRLTTLSKKILINSDDAICRSIGVVSKNKKSYFGKGNNVDFHLQLLVESEGHSLCCIQKADEKHLVTMPVVGEYQCSNVLAAISSVAELGFSLDEICRAVSALTLPEGRYEQIQNNLGISIYIDYAHTPDAMKMVLQTLKNQTKKRLIVVFSCGGERDQAKRPKMGLIASTFADYIILTTDNARGENPQKINDQIKKGFVSFQLYEVILNRQKAIAQALKVAKKGDIVIILGKGHEKTQHIGSAVSHFSDKECVLQAIEQLETS